MRKFSLALALCLLASNSYADGTINTLSAGSALTGTEQIPMYQGGNPAVSTTPAAIKTYVGAGISCPAGFTPVIADCVWTQTATNSASIAWTGLTLSEYMLRCHNLIPASGTAVLGVQVGEGGTPTYNTTNSSYHTEGNVSGNGGINVAKDITNSAWFYLDSILTTGNIGLGFDMNLHALNSATLTKTFTATALIGDAGPVYYVGAYAGFFSADTNAVTALRVIDTVGGNITSGTCSLYAKGS